MPRPIRVVEGTLRYKIAQFFLWLLYGRQWHYISPWAHIGCAAGVVMFHNGKALVTRRSPTMHYYPNKYSTIGGYIDAKSDSGVIEALLREIREETGLVLSPENLSWTKQLLRVANFPRYTTPDMGPHHQMNFQFAIVLSDRQAEAIKPVGESATLYWYTLDEITTLYQAGEFAYAHEYDFYQAAFQWLAKHSKKAA